VESREEKKREEGRGKREEGREKREERRSMARTLAY
jgi:hypothetical protein